MADGRMRSFLSHGFRVGKRGPLALVRCTRNKPPCGRRGLASAAEGGKAAGAARTTGLGQFFFRQDRRYIEQQARYRALSPITDSPAPDHYTLLYWQQHVRGAGVRGGGTAPRCVCAQAYITQPHKPLHSEAWETETPRCSQHGHTQKWPLATHSARYTGVGRSSPPGPPLLLACARQSHPHTPPMCALQPPSCNFHSKFMLGATAARLQSPRCDAATAGESTCTGQPASTRP